MTRRARRWLYATIVALGATTLVWLAAAAHAGITATGLD
jgi:hypothetical protein